MNQGEAALRPISLLGAPGTGRAQLASELRVALSAHGLPAFVVAINDHPPLPTSALHASGPTLLMGLDLPAPPGTRDQRDAADRRLRDDLAQAGIAYQVVYGQGAERLQSALRALQPWLPCPAADAAPAARSDDPLARWGWSCDSCSDPQCERRLLSDLLQARSLSDLGIVGCKSTAAVHSSRSF